MQLTLTSQLNAIAELTRLSHLDVLSGDVKSAVHLLNRARGLMGEVLQNVGSGTNQSHRTQEVLVTPTHESSNENDSKLLNEISQAQLGRSYGKANETQQQVIRRLATRVLGREVNDGRRKDGQDDARHGKRAVEAKPLEIVQRTSGRQTVCQGDTKSDSASGGVATGNGAAGQISYKQWLRENKR